MRSSSKTNVKEKVEMSIVRFVLTSHVTAIKPGNPKLIGIPLTRALMQATSDSLETRRASAHLNLQPRSVGVMFGWLPSDRLQWFDSVMSKRDFNINSSQILLARVESFFFSIAKLLV